MVELLMSMACAILGSVLCFADNVEHGLLLLLISSVWYLSSDLSRIYSKLEEIQEDFYTEMRKRRNNDS